MDVVRGGGTTEAHDAVGFQVRVAFGVGIVLIVSGLVQLGTAITWGRAGRTLETERTPT